MPALNTTDPMLENTDAGLYCRICNFYIDPWRPVERAVITHAHADHARAGCGSYLAAPECARLIKGWRAGWHPALPVLNCPAPHTAKNQGWIP